MELKEALIAWIRNYFKENANSKTIAVLGISGGKDSSICAALLVEALGKERVLGVLMPNGKQKDINDSLELCKYLDLKHIIIDISKTYLSLSQEIMNNLDLPLTKQYRTNTPARLRMATLYGVSHVLANARVCNTGNLSEAMLGYTTLYGDFAGDFAPLRMLTKREVVNLGLELNLPKELVLKAPGDGMSGKTDEDNLGFTYDEVDDLILHNLKGPHYNLISQRFKTMEFKRKIINIPCFKKEEI